MKTSIEQLKGLIEVLGGNWKQELDNFFKEDDISTDGDSANKIMDFLEVCKEEIIEENTASLQKVEKLIDNDLLYKNMCEYIEEMLRPYYVSAPLRTLEVKEPGAAVRTIEVVFERAVLRFDPNIPQRYEELGFANEDIFIDFLNTFNAVCTFVVSKNFCFDAIEDFIFTRTRLPKKVCIRVAEMLDENFNQLKINYIVERLNSN